MKYTLLEPLRGLAALWVFTFHFAFSEAVRERFPAFHALCKLGDLGVAMFFVISGFCIAASARSTLRKHEPVGRFLYRRIRRIYPPYWFSILVVAALPFVIELMSALKTGLYLPPSGDNVSYGFMHYRPIEWLRVTTLAQVFVPMPAAASLQHKFATINSVYWTLAIEVQFYLVVGVAVWLRPFFSRVLAAVTLLSVPLLFLPSAYVTGLFLPYWPMFAVGVILYYLCEHGYVPSRLFGRSAAAFSAILVLVCGMSLFWYALNRPPLSPLSFAVCFGVMLYAAEGLEASFRQALSSRFLIMRWLMQLLMTLGAMSYSLYLLHAKLQFLSMQMIRQVFATNTMAHDLSVIVLTMLTCYLFHVLCERPFMGSRDLRPEQAVPARRATSEALA